MVMLKLLTLLSLCIKTKTPVPVGTPKELEDIPFKKLKLVILVKN